MADCIKIEKTRHNLSSGQTGVLKHELLKGEIEGVTTNHVIVHRGAVYEAYPSEQRSLVFLFFSGKGVIRHGVRTFPFHRLSVFVPDAQRSFAVEAHDPDIAFLEIILELSKPDQVYLKTVANKYPYFANYADCHPYKEDIKSKKTVSRMLIPNNLVPRMSMGSVQTIGPDEVAPHSHPMLEQLFYGLPENSCYVTADGHEALFEEDTLLHIPLGSNHGVRVSHERHLHYIWMDFFRNQKDMSYISDAHVMLDQ